MTAFDFHAELADIKAKQLFRSRRELQTAQGSRVIVDGRALYNFCSNDYLGMANHIDVVMALKRSADHYGVGAGASHLVCGHSQEHHSLEKALAAWLRQPRALLFSSGYMANLGIIKALLSKGDAIFEDRLNHASLIDAGLSCGADFQRYAHLNLIDLERRLCESHARRKLIVTDSVFSMDGDLAPLPELLDLAEKYDAFVMVDDAHGIGVLGNTGAGVIEHFAWPQSERLIVMGTLGKAVGTYGAFAVGSESFIEYLVNKARTYIYTTALPPAVAAATRASINIIQKDSARRNKLNDLINQFKNGCEAIGLTVLPSNSPIQAIILGASDAALTWSRALEAQGFWVGAIRPPTVPTGTARLRITLSALHEPEDVAALINALDVIHKENPITPVSRGG